MANVKISQDPAASTLDGTEIVPLLQSGTNKRTTAQEIADLSNGHVIEEKGIAVTDRSILNFINGITVSDNVTKTEINLGGTLSADLNWTKGINENFVVGGGISLAGTLRDLYVLGQDITISSDTNDVSWNQFFGEGHTISALTTGRIRNSSILGGYVNSMYVPAFNSDIFNATIIGGEGNSLDVRTTLDKVESAILGNWYNLVDKSGGVALGQFGHNSGRFSLTFGYEIGSIFGAGAPLAQRTLASGIHAINMSANSTSQTVNHGALADYSVILGGQDHNIPSDSPRSVILGGNAIKARVTDPDQVYVPNFNIASQPINDDALTEILVRDATTGQIKYRASSSISSLSWPLTGEAILTGNVVIRGDSLYSVQIGKSSFGGGNFQPLTAFYVYATNSVTIAVKGASTEQNIGLTISTTLTKLTSENTLTLSLRTGNEYFYQLDKVGSATFGDMGRQQFELTSGDTGGGSKLIQEFKGSNGNIGSDIWLWSATMTTPAGQKSIQMHDNLPLGEIQIINTFAGSAGVTLIGIDTANFTNDSLVTKAYADGLIDNVTVDIQCTTGGINLITNDTGYITLQTLGVGSGIILDDLLGGGGIQVTSSGATVDLSGTSVNVTSGKFTTVASASSAAINVGFTAGNPTVPVNGDLYYNSVANELRAYINSGWVALGGGGLANTTTNFSSQTDFGTTSDGRLRFETATANFAVGDVYMYNIGSGTFGGANDRATLGIFSRNSGEAGFKDYCVARFDNGTGSKYSEMVVGADDSAFHFARLITGDGTTTSEITAQQTGSINIVASNVSGVSTSLTVFASTQVITATSTRSNGTTTGRVLDMVRENSAGAGANNIGGSYGLILENSISQLREAFVVEAVFTNATGGAEETTIKWHSYDGGAVVSSFMQFDTPTLTLALSGGLQLSADATQQIRTAHIQLTTAQVKALNTTPITIVAAPTSGKYIQVINASLKLTYATATYVGSGGSDGDVLLQVGATVFSSGTTDVLLATANRTVSMVGVAETISEATALTVTAANDFVTGDSPVDIYVQYMVVDTN